jgi:hypothetical protein
VRNQTSAIRISIGRKIVSLCRAADTDERVAIAPFVTLMPRN